MAKIEFRLSSKVQQDGRAEVMMRLFQGSRINQSTGTEIFVSTDFFEYYIDRAKTERLGVRVPPKAQTATLDEAEKFGFVLRNSGKLVVNNRRLRTPDVAYHEQANKQLEELTNVVLENFNKAGLDTLPKGWLKDVVDRYKHPEKYQVKNKTGFFDFTDEYLKAKQFSESREKSMKVLFRDVARYIGFVNATDKQRKNFSFDLNTVTKADIEDFRDYIRNEKELSNEYPKVFDTLLRKYPTGIGKGQGLLRVKGENSVIALMKALRTYFAWLNQEDITTNDPFKGVVIGTPHYGNPYYITIAERNKIADTDLQSIWESMSESEKKGNKVSIETLIQQRDIFVFQCFVGCRVGDLMRLTSKNIINGELQYVPHKTVDDGMQAVMAVVPLHPKALALVKKYQGVDPQGRLFPYISEDKYNDAIKLIFKMSGVTREVIVRNPTTGEFEPRHINEIASSHLARRTFVGNAYLKAPDPSIVGAMSGHVEGSKSFRRYRNIEESTKRAIIEQMG